jgi:hypothetical protein
MGIGDGAGNGTKVLGVGDGVGLQVGAGVGHMPHDLSQEWANGQVGQKIMSQ